MQVETQAAIYSATNFHSNKTNKDYHKVGLIIEGQAGEFFVADKLWSDIVRAPYFNTLNVSRIPQVVKVLIDLHFTDKGPRIDVAGIHELPKGK